jgi:hypothetical protein
MTITDAELLALLHAMQCELDIVRSELAAMNATPTIGFDVETFEPPPKQILPH